MAKIILAVGSGGFLGSVLRYLVYRYFENPQTSGWPWGTMAVNILGSLLAGFLFGLSEKTNLIPETLSLFLLVGFCGGFTTFSAFALDNVKLFQEGAFAQNFLYISSTILLGVLAIFIGHYLSTTLIR
ncbi:MAG: fluoride efflux transporter CrcB [Bacteroidetes bacterium]|jgi:fluoride exporter|nr:fluoride efflux transporter CrcB [Bacteroidota bacterium]MBT3751009.1 fluoride efflux transporter CrcB [Bacteroidota bacterium]MBT4400961.1 fluoride efflux transporter CrcB [Bacteroidota bacterium]MBT4409104.1 fluoride efflux transporter CrcB [Bacteroidota bacterium]MBT5426465.1 fluoride efflux transporter CrcB [Bacteroidota bacterium]